MSQNKPKEGGSETAELLNEASGKLHDANLHVQSGNEEQAMMAVEQCMEDLREAVAEYDVGQEHGPMWELARGDVESYVGCELADIAFGALGSSVILVFEKEGGDLHGLKLAPRKNIQVCDVSVSE